MTTQNKNMTFQEAKKIHQSTNASFPNTDHNKNMMRKVVDEQIKSLINEVIIQN